MEEERRLFYVAVTRAKKSVVLSFAVSRMRNGKHESNAPSRFLRDVNPCYRQNPGLLSSRFGGGDEPEDEAPRAPRFGGTFRFGSAKHYSWKEESKPSTTRSVTPPVGPPPAVPSEKRRLVNSRTGLALSEEEVKRIGGLRTLPPKKEDFVPTPVGELRTGDAIEHDRFGQGRILEITGTPPDLKAKIDFTRYGVKILLLKYAKLRKITLG